MKYVLAIETSCDDTSVALVAESGDVLSCISQSQDSSHAQFGGIVPEIASRNHTKFLMPLVEKILNEQKLSPTELAGLAVTNRPGLIGSLIVGVSTAKTLALLWGKPWIAVNHLEGHILAPFLKDKSYQPKFGWDKPFLALTVSGGHTSIYHVRSLFNYELLGSSLDDAAGEAFDKFGKMLGLGFPGGVQVDRLAQTGDPLRFHFPRGLIKEDHLNMSFSGLKSASHRLLSAMSAEEIEANKADLCASFQAAVVDALMAKLIKAEEKLKLGRVVVTGGVSANSGLRKAVEDWSAKSGVQFQIPPLRFCTDNAAMIGLAGALHMQNGESSEMNLGPSPQALPTDFKISKDYLDAASRIRRGAP